MRLPRRRGLAISAIEGEREAMQFGPDATSARWYRANRQRRWWARVIHPNSDFRKCWDAVVSLAALGLIWQVPLHLVFEWWIPPLALIDRLVSTLWVPTLVLRALAQCLFAADVMLNLRTGYVTRDGVLVMDEWKIVRRYALRWLLVDLVCCLPLETLYPEDHAASWLGPYACRKRARSRERSTDTALFYCERQLGLRGKLRNVRRVLSNLPPVPRMVGFAKGQRQLLPTLRALPWVVRRTARTISTAKRLKWFKLGRMLQLLRLVRALYDRAKYAYHSTRKRLRARQLWLRSQRQLRRKSPQYQLAAGGGGDGGGFGGRLRSFSLTPLPQQRRVRSALGWLSPRGVRRKGDADPGAGRWNTPPLALLREADALCGTEEAAAAAAAAIAAASAPATENLRVFATPSVRSLRGGGDAGRSRRLYDHDECRTGAHADDDDTDDDEDDDDDDDDNDDDDDDDDDGIADCHAAAYADAASKSYYHSTGSFDTARMRRSAGGPDPRESVLRQLQQLAAR